MIKRTFKKSNFTLVELLVAMAVFTILLMVSMQIFGNSQKLWVNSEQKNNAFASARSAMEFIAARIQSNAYSENMPFLINSKKQEDTGNSQMYFPTSMPMNRKKKKDDKLVERDLYNLRFIKFSVDEESGKLQMTIFSDENDKSFLQHIPPYAKSFDPTKIANGLASGFASAAAKEYNQVEIAENVTEFKLTCYKSGNRTPESGELTSPPDLLVITLSVIDSKANFDKWKDPSADKSEIFQEHGYTFQRAVLFRQRRAE